MKYATTIFLLFILSLSSKAQRPEGLVNNFSIKRISSKKLTDHLGVQYRYIQTAEKSKKNWLGKRPKKGTGYGEYKVSQYTYKAHWKAYKLHGDVQVTYKDAVIFEGSAVDGILTKGTFYKLRYYVPLPSDESQEEYTAKYKDIFGTYAIPAFSGTVKATGQKNIYRFAKGIEFFERDKTLKDNYSIPFLTYALYTERSPELNGKTYYFKNTRSFFMEKRTRKPSWSILTISELQNGKIEGKFISHAQDKYIVEGLFSNGKAVDKKYRILDKKSKKEIPFTEGKIKYKIEKTAYLSQLAYYNKQEHTAYTKAEKKKKEMSAHAEKMRLKRKKTYQENQNRYAKRLKEKEKAKEQARWQKVSTACNTYKIPGDPEYGEATSQPVNVRYGKGQESIQGFELWHRYRKLYDKVSKADYAVAYSANYTYKKSNQYKFLVATALANSIFPSSAFVSATNSKNISWDVTISDADKNEWYFSYPDREGKIVYVKALNCESSVEVRIIRSSQRSFEKNKDYKKFMFQ